MDQPSRPPRSGTRRVVLAIVGVVVLLCIVFGVSVVHQKSRFDEYRAATLEGRPMPWTERAMTVEQCVAFTVDWMMGCPGVESWCSGHAPRLTLECLGSVDRSPDCSAYGSDVGSTSFGYAPCERMREPVEGTHAKRAHKKACAAAYRAVAEHCRELGPTDPAP